MNGICKFTLKEGQEISLLFGMRSVFIFSEKLGNEMHRNNISDAKKIDAFKTFSYIIYAGLCNDAERKDEPYPSFEKAYDIACEVQGDSEISKLIFDTYNDSKATKEMLDKLASSTQSDTKEAKKKTISKNKPSQ